MTHLQLRGNGSSPRLRGTCKVDRLVQFVRRFIPALAGNILNCYNKTYKGAVHPRACGEHGIMTV